MRTGQISGAHFMEAIAWSKETATWLEKKHNLPKIHLWLDGAGHAGTIRWTMDFADLTAFEKAQGSILMDAEYWKAVAKAVDAKLFVQDHFTDSISREV